MGLGENHRATKLSYIKSQQRWRPKPGTGLCGFSWLQAIWQAPHKVLDLTYAPVKIFIHKLISFFFCNRPQPPKPKQPLSAWLTFMRLPCRGSKCYPSTQKPWPAPEPGYEILPFKQTNIIIIINSFACHSYLSAWPMYLSTQGHRQKQRRPRRTELLFHQTQPFKF